MLFQDIQQAVRSLPAETCQGVNETVRGYFIERYNRFLADIRTPTGEKVTAYCPATGRMKTCLRKNAPVEYLRVANSDRKLDYDWWSIRMPESWVIIDTRPANRWLYWQRTGPWFPGHWREATWQSEPQLPDGGRLDFRLDFENRPTTWIEIKSVTWCDGGVGYFPDAPTDRGLRHLKALEELADRGDSTYVVFVSMRSDIREIQPATSMDPEFSKQLRKCREEGVHLIGLGSFVDDRLLQFRKSIDVVTDH